MSSNASHVDANTASAQALLANDKLPWHRKITYGFTDMSGNLLYCIISSYMLYFFTNVFGLSVAMAGVISLIARFFDAIGAPIMGILVDHTHSKYGRVVLGSCGCHYHLLSLSGCCSPHHRSVPVLKLFMPVLCTS